MFRLHVISVDVCNLSSCTPSMQLSLSLPMTPALNLRHSLQESSHAPTPEAHCLLSHHPLRGQREEREEGSKREREREGERESERESEGGRESELGRERERGREIERESERWR